MEVPRYRHLPRTRTQRKPSRIQHGRGTLLKDGQNQMLFMEIWQMAHIRLEQQRELRIRLQQRGQKISQRL